MMQYLIDLVLSFQTMDGRNYKDNNRYRLRNHKHNIHNAGSGREEEDSDKQISEDKYKEEEEVDRPHRRRRVDKEDNKDPEENLDVPVKIDFEGDLDQILNPEGRVGGHVENNGQRGALTYNQGQGGGGRGRTANNGGGGCGGGGCGVEGCGGDPQGPSAAAVNQERRGKGSCPKKVIFLKWYQNHF